MLALWPVRSWPDPAPVHTVSSVDLQRYAGTWYEVARLPNRFQAQCVSDTQAHYELMDDGVRVVNRCRTSKGTLDEIKGRAKVVPGSGDAKLRVTFFWPFYGDYWVLAFDSDHSDVLVGSPDRRFAWVLARQPRLAPKRWDELMQRADAPGFPTSAFVRTPHTVPLAAGQHPEGGASP